MPVSKGDEEKREEQSASGGVAADEGEGKDASDGQLVPVAAADEDDAAEEKGKKENEEKESRENIDQKGSSFAGEFCVCKLTSSTVFLTVNGKRYCSSSWLRHFIIHQNFTAGEIIIIIMMMYICHALIKAVSPHVIHVNLNTIFYTYVEDSLTKTTKCLLYVCTRFMQIFLKVCVCVCVFVCMHTPHFVLFVYTNFKNTDIIGFQRWRVIKGEHWLYFICILSRSLNSTCENSFSLQRKGSARERSD